MEQLSEQSDAGRRWQQPFQHVEQQVILNQDAVGKQNWKIRDEPEIRGVVYHLRYDWDPLARTVHACFFQVVKIF